MRLKVRAIQLRVSTPDVLCGTDITFEDGLVVLRADNTTGKSTVVQSIIYALGLEGMLSASYNVPLPHVMTDSIDVENGKLAVNESWIAVEIENGKGEIATVNRAAKGGRNKNLITVSTGAVITGQADPSDVADYYVREPGAAVNERGFHRWFANFVEWTLPKVRRVDGSECPLYVECIFPLMIIEQKKGWSAIQARMPFHYRIRDVAKKAFEFLLSLDVYELALQRQKLREEAFELRSEWRRHAIRVDDLARSINAVVGGLDATFPSSWEPAAEPAFLLSRGTTWLPFSTALLQDSRELDQLERDEIPRVKEIEAEVEARLTKVEADLSETDFAASELFVELEQDRLQLGNLQQRLDALEEDERRNRDLVKLKRLGSMQTVAAATGHCPTCHQSVNDALLPQMDSQPTMSAEENLRFIQSQRDMFLTIRDAAATSVTAKERRLASLRERASELRRVIRSLRQTLVTEGNEPSVEAIERRLRLREKITKARAVETEFTTELDALRDIGTRWKANQAALSALPKGDLSERDQRKLQAFREIFVSELRQFGLISVDPNSLRISEDNYRPEHDGFDLEFDLSASDMIRTLWAYLHGLLEVARNETTNHLGLLILDEPKQQETNRVSFRELFQRASTAGQSRQQVIIATSEDEATLAPLLKGVQHQYIGFSGRIIRPLAPVEPPGRSTDPRVPSEGENSDDTFADDGEMPWEAHAREAVERALESMDFDPDAKAVRLTGFNDETLVANSREDLESRLRTIAADSWIAYVPFDGGEPVFECDEWGIVESAITPYENTIDEFFAGLTEGGDT